MINIISHALSLDKTLPYLCISRCRPNVGVTKNGAHYTQYIVIAGVRETLWPDGETAVATLSRRVEVSVESGRRGAGGCLSGGVVEARAAGCIEPRPGREAGSRARRDGPQGTHRGPRQLR